MEPLPKGINQVSLISAAVSICLILYAIAGWGINNVGSEQLQLTAMTALGIEGLILSLLLLNGCSRKSLYFALMANWSLLLGYWFTWQLINLDRVALAISEGSSYVIIFGPMVYSVFCLGYFFTKTPKQYFHMVSKPVLNSKIEIH
jgi:hypothetical protein